VSSNNRNRSGIIHYGALFGGPLAAILLVLFVDLDPAHPEVTRTAAVALLMAVWWISEVIPLAVTSLLPFVLFPALGVMNGKAVAPIYFNHVIFLFMGGFLVALAMQRWNLHRRIALRTLLIFGAKPKSILLGFMVATAFLSMWISNTATTMMMVPIVLAVILRLEESAGAKVIRRYSIGLFLGVAYSASAGGIATLIGTPPNLSFVRIIAITFPDAPEISFASWLLFALPISLALLLVIWLLLTFLFCPRDLKGIDRGVFIEQHRALGPMGYEEKVVLVDFVLLAALWMFRADISIGGVVIPGWSNLFALPAYLNDGTVAIAMSVLLFLIPARSEPGRQVMDWETASKLPWHIILLFGGGFALASGFKESGLAAWMGGRLEGLSSLHPLLLVAAVCLLITFLTELTSNTATAEILLPILAALAVALQLNPLLLMIPGTISCSLAFMLPVATPPNAIVFGTDRLQVSDMARTGLVLNLVGTLTVVLGIWFLGRVVLGIDLADMPVWAVME
jgi:sodium-dependent dicarboxylate transporter 2/3/5